MRLRPAALTIAGRKVISPSCYTLPDNSVTVPYGSYLTLPMYAIHRDKNNYPPRPSDGDEFDGFRSANSSSGGDAPLVTRSSRGARVDIFGNSPFRFLSREATL